MDELYDFGWDHSRKTPGQMDAIDGGRIRQVAAERFGEHPHVVVRLGPAE